MEKEIELEKQAEFEHRLEEEEKEEDEKCLLKPNTSSTDVEQVEEAMGFSGSGVHFEMPLKDRRSKFYVLVKKLVVLALFVAFLFASLALRFELQSNPAFAQKIFSTHTNNTNTNSNSTTVGK